MRKQTLVRFTVMAALALLIPTAVSAQGWPDYRNDRGYGRYDNRYLRDSIHRLDRLAKDFERAVDRDLDRSREDGSRHEDRLNNEARNFRDAVGDLKSRFGNGRDLNRSSNEAQRVLQQANRTERSIRHHFDDRRLASMWSQIRSELNVIANAYGTRPGIYGRNDDYRRPYPNNAPWWQRIPFPN